LGPTLNAKGEFRTAQTGMRSRSLSPELRQTMGDSSGIRDVGSRKKEESPGSRYIRRSTNKETFRTENIENQNRKNEKRICAVGERGKPACLRKQLGMRRMRSPRVETIKDGRNSLKTLIQRRASTCHLGVK